MSLEKENASEDGAPEAHDQSPDCRVDNQDSTRETPDELAALTPELRENFGFVAEHYNAGWSANDAWTREEIDRLLVQPSWLAQAYTDESLVATSTSDLIRLLYTDIRLRRATTQNLSARTSAHRKVVASIPTLRKRPSQPPTAITDDVLHAVLAHTSTVEVAPSLLETLAGQAPKPGSWEAQLAQALADVQTALGTGTERKPRTRPLFVPALELIARPKPPKPWLVNSLITEGTTSQVAGVPKVAKSWWLTEIAVGVASGTRVGGHFPTGEPKKVAYFYAEDHERDVCAHLLALVAGRDMDPAEVLKNLHVQPRGEFIDVMRDEDLALIVASCRAMGGVALLCLDPLRDLHSAAEDLGGHPKPASRGHLKTGQS